MAREDIVSKLSTDHASVFQTIQLLEAALKELLQMALTAYEADEETLNSHVKGFMSYFNKDITLHFRIEEEAVFPELKGEKLVKGLLKEHGEIRSTFGGITTATDGETKLKLLRQGMDLLRKHAENEEKNLLPLIKAKIGSEKLKGMMEKAQRLLNTQSR